MLANLSVGDMPAMSSYARNSSTYSPVKDFGAAFGGPHQADELIADELVKRRISAAKAQLPQANGVLGMAVGRRLVQVIVSDPNQSVPLESCILYKGDEKVTDLEDNELYFEIDIKKLLEDYNVKRVEFRNKAIKDRIENLEPARIRDLRMIVVTVAAL